MKSNKVLYTIIGIVALIVLNVVLFMLIKTYSTATYINIAGANLAVVVLWLGCIIRTDKKETVFLQYVKLPIVITYSAITFYVSISLLVREVETVEISIAAQVILLGALIVALCVNKIANNKTIQQTTKDKQKYASIQEMAKSLYSIMQEIDDSKTYKKIEEAYDAIKNGKVSVETETAEIDGEIKEIIKKIEENGKAKQMELLEENVKAIKSLMNKRNNC